LTGDAGLLVDCRPPAVVFFDEAYLTPGTHTIEYGGL
jgi:hypothetical protein